MEAPYVEVHQDVEVVLDIQQTGPYGHANQAVDQGARNRRICKGHSGNAAFGGVAVQGLTKHCTELSADGQGRTERLPAHEEGMQQPDVVGVHDMPLIKARLHTRAVRDGDLTVPEGGLLGCRLAVWSCHRGGALDARARCLFGLTWDGANSDPELGVAGELANLGTLGSA
jgi:hypothetical protein